MESTVKPRTVGDVVLVVMLEEGGALLYDDACEQIGGVKVPQEDTAAIVGLWQHHFLRIPGHWFSWLVHTLDDGAGHLILSGEYILHPGAKHSLATKSVGCEPIPSALNPWALQRGPSGLMVRDGEVILAAEH